MSDAWITLFLVLIPAIGGIASASAYFGRRWRRRHWLRKLDEIFEADREWWEAQFDDVGDERSPE